MKTLNELYGEVMASNELKREYFAAAGDGKAAEFLKNHGCDATENELSDFLANPANLPQGEIADDELDAVAGGTCYKGGRPVVTILNTCDYWTCEKCGTAPAMQSSCEPGNPTQPSGKYCVCGRRSICMVCRYCQFEKGLWLCNSPSRKNN